MTGKNPAGTASAPIVPRARKNDPPMLGVASAATKRLSGVSVSRAIKPALAHASDKLNAARRTRMSKLPDRGWKLK